MSRIQVVEITIPLLTQDLLGVHEKRLVRKFFKLRVGKVLGQKSDLTQLRSTSRWQPRWSTL